jgi:ParB family chromosome partitioning protein
MANRRGLGRGLGAIIPEGNVSRETTPANSDTEAGDAAATASRVTPTNPAKAASGSAAKAAGPGSTGSEDAGAQSAPQQPVAVAGLTFTELAIDEIVPNHAQPRTVFDEEALAELVHSIKEIGLLQPIVVRTADKGYELIAGERRLRASKLAGLTSIPALIRETADDKMLRDALLENLHRSALTPLEEAAAYQQLLSDFGGTQEELATRLGRSRPQISNTLRLLNLPPAVQRRVAAGVLSAGHARALLGLKDVEAMELLAKRIVAEGLSVRSVEEIVSVGVDKPKKKGAPKTTGTISAPGLTELGDRMSARLDTRVTVQLGAKRGKVVIDFATLEDLRRIVEIVDPPRLGMFGEPLN